MAGVLLEATVAWAKRLSETNRKKHKEVAGKSWRRWVHEQLATGGRALHKFVKRQAGQLDEVIEVRGSRSASAQDIVDSAVKGWQDIWCRVGLVTSAPWRLGWADVRADTLGQPTIRELRTAASKFREWTGMGNDALPPRL